MSTSGPPVADKDKPLSIPTEAPVHAPILKTLGPAAILGAAWTILPAVLGGTLLVKLGPVSDWLQSLGAWGWAAYALVFMISAGIGFLPTYGQSMLGGWTFGFGFGFVGAMIGFVGGSIIGYCISRTVSKERIEQVLREHPKGQIVRDAMLRHGFWRAVGVITLIRLPPNSPFALTNLVLTASGAKLGPYILGTALGMAPRTAIAVWIAAEGSKRANDIQELFKNESWWVLAAGVALAVVMFGILALIAKRAIATALVAPEQAPPASNPAKDAAA